ncbi:MAG TPA: DUF4118 domain-containing protein [Chthonomonadaceae bacterium]|nr:DUF4118 domain-containing protein [Chthonomonadaceae bacterium]
MSAIEAGPRPVARAAVGAAGWLLRNAYAAAAGSVLCALCGTLLLRGLLPDRHLSFVLFFAAVALSAGLGGLRAGLLATVLSALICDYFFLRPLHSFVLAASDLPLLVVFIVAAALINGVSERLRAQTQRADQRYYSLVQGLDGIVWEKNPRSGAFTFVSRHAERLLGYPADRWLAEPEFLMRVIHPDDAERIQILHRDALATGGEHTADYRVRTADAEDLWLRETVFVGHDSRGRPNRVTGLAIDITARKAEAEELTQIRDELAVLNRIGVALSASLELPDFVAALRHQLRAIGIATGCLYLAEETSDALRLADAWGAQDAIPGGEPSILPALVSPAAGADDAGAAPRVAALHELPDTLALDAATATLESHGALAIPLVAKDELRGVLGLCARQAASVPLGRGGFYGSLGRQVGTLLQNVTLYQEVRAARERLHQLSRQLVDVQEAERRAIARELHDEIGQVLSGLKLTLETSPRGAAGERTTELERALSLVQDLIRQVEGISLDLRPAILDDLGLLPALDWHCERYTTLTGVRVQIDHTGVSGRFAPEIEITAYRIVQEALTNVARHAGVDCAKVRLWATREILGVQVEDLGRGFDLAAVSSDPAACGLAGMNERAALVGGHVAIETAVGLGTSITIDLPLGDWSSLARRGE